MVAVAVAEGQARPAAQLISAARTERSKFTDPDDLA
jgi:hypothetical protein